MTQNPATRATTGSSASGGTVFGCPSPPRSCAMVRRIDGPPGAPLTASATVATTAKTATSASIGANPVVREVS